METNYKKIIKIDSCFSYIFAGTAKQVSQKLRKYNSNEIRIEDASKDEVKEYKQMMIEWAAAGGTEK